MDPQSTVLLVLILTISSVAGHNFDSKKSPGNSTGQPEVAVAGVVKGNDTKSGDLDDRIGLTVRRGQAHAIGPNGAVSGSQALTYNYEVGILRPGLAYQPLYDRTGGHSSSYSTGPGAPHTWAASHNNNRRPGGIGGGSYSGYQGGQGSATADSYTQVQKILLNPFDGTTLYSNLNNNVTTHHATQQNRTQSLDSTKTEVIQKDEVKKQGDELTLV